MELQAVDIKLHSDLSVLDFLYPTCKTLFIFVGISKQTISRSAIHEELNEL